MLNLGFVLRFFFVNRAPELPEVLKWTNCTWYRPLPVEWVITTKPLLLDWTWLNIKSLRYTIFSIDWTLLLDYQVTTRCTLQYAILIYTYAWERPTVDEPKTGIIIFDQSRVQFRRCLGTGLGLGMVLNAQIQLGPKTTALTHYKKIKGRLE